MDIEAITELSNAQNVNRTHQSQAIDSNETIAASQDVHVSADVARLFKNEPSLSTTPILPAPIAAATGGTLQLDPQAVDHLANTLSPRNDNGELSYQADLSQYADFTPTTEAAQPIAAIPFATESELPQTPTAGEFKTDSHIIRDLPPTVTIQGFV